MRKALIVWRRTGKEHGEDSFRVNPPTVIDEHIRSKVERLRATPDEDWRWWQLSDEVLVEIPEPGEHYKPSTRIYYLPKRHCVAIADLRFCGFRRERRSWEPELYWYVHIGTIEFAPAYDAWVFSDLFADVLASRDGLIYRIKDLDDVAEVMRLGLIDMEKTAFILERTQVLVETMRKNEFPFPELREAMGVDKRLTAHASRSASCKIGY